MPHLNDLIKNSKAVYYPSAGWDLRDLMVMSGITPKHVSYSYRDELLSRGAQLFGKNDNGESILPQPDLFVHSDILSWEKAIKFKLGEIFYKRDVRIFSSNSNELAEQQGPSAI